MNRERYISLIWAKKKIRLWSKADFVGRETVLNSLEIDLSEKFTREIHANTYWDQKSTKPISEMSQLIHDILFIF